MVELDKGLDVLRIILRHTRDHPIKAAAIEELTGVDTRHVSELFAEFTRRGFPVCSGAGGFWRAQTEKEFQDQLAKERDRAIDILRKVNGGKRNFCNNLTLFEQDAA